LVYADAMRVIRNSRPEMLYDLSAIFNRNLSHGVELPNFFREINPQN